MITDQINRDQSIVFKVLVKPLVNLIWLAGLRLLRGLARRALAERRRAAAPRGALPRAARARTGMTALAIAIGALLAAACALYVALPFLREPDPSSDLLDEPGALERRALELAEQRDRALAALKELEFDHRTGKISDDDYRELDRPAAAARRRSAARARAPHRVERGASACRGLSARAAAPSCRRRPASVPSAARGRTQSSGETAVQEVPATETGPVPVEPQVARAAVLRRSALDVAARARRRDFRPGDRPLRDRALAVGADRPRRRHLAAHRLHLAVAAASE